MNSLFQVICRMGIFMVCAQAIVHFRPEESYGKYLKLLVSAMVLIQLFLPVGRLLFHGDSGELALKSEAFLKGLEEEIAAAERKAYESDALLERMTLEEVRRRMEEERAAALGNEDRENEDGGDSGDDRVSGDSGDSGDDRVSGDGEGSRSRIEVEEIRVRIQKDN